jgi:adenylosuccinate synthase
MANLIVVGAQWGDEGKGKVVDILSEWFDAVARYQGGNNAGHTVVVGDEKVVLHLVPSGVLRRGKICVLGNGVVIDLEALIHEMDQLERLQVRLDDHFFVSKGAHLVMPYHKILDAAREERAQMRIGTTGRGIGPAYVDKMARVGIRVAALEDPAIFKDRLAHNLAEARERHPESTALAALDLDRIYADHLRYAERIRPFLADTSAVLDRMLREGKRVLFEGAQGTLLDIDHGTYPFVTSTNTTAGGACTGSGVGPTKIGAVIGVSKAYATRVGGGPFPTEMFDEEVQKIRDRGNEYGSTTGRPRRCGWFDAPVVRYANRLNGLAGIALTKLDVLSGLPSVKVCVAYEIDGVRREQVPLLLTEFEAAKPVYEQVEGWKEDISSAREFGDLPKAARKYVQKVEEITSVEVSLVSVGPDRNQTIVRRNPFRA